MLVDDDHCFSGLDAYKQVIEASDVVLIANAAKFHPIQMAAAIEAGKHVFVEKPHAIDPAGIHLAARACEVAKQKNLGVLSGLHSRFQANIRETMQRIHDGQIGEIVAIEENFLRGPYGNTRRRRNCRNSKTSTPTSTASRGCAATTSRSRWCITWTAPPGR
jgi:myo-inositol 2-dehydrogenase / D-chiro-inositol 1-dehydrogenase